MLNSHRYGILIDMGYYWYEPNVKWLAKGDKYTYEVL